MAEESNVVPMDGKMNMRALIGALVNRYRLAGVAGMQFGGKRDLYKVFGYREYLKFQDYYAKYRRQDIASRIIDALPNATWRGGGVKLDGDEALESAWEELSEDLSLPMTFQRVDRLSAMGNFSLLLLGFNDTGDLSRPVRPASGRGRPRELLYINPIGDISVRDVSFVKDVTDRRYGKPEMYTIARFDESIISAGGTNLGSEARSIADRLRDRANFSLGKTMKVHWSRVIHVVNNPLESDAFSIPLIERIYNLLDDLLKVSGGSAEAFWLIANRGMQADVDPEINFDPEDAEALKDEIEEYQHELRRFIRTRGVKLNVLDNKTASPKDTFDLIMALISGTTGIPRRVLLGAEAGVIASEQDRASWAERIGEHRDLSAEPSIVRPFISRLQELEILPQGKYKLDWPLAFILNPLEEGMMMAQKARAVGNMSRQTGNQTPMQITSREEVRDIIMLEGDLDESELFMNLPEGQKAEQERQEELDREAERLEAEANRNEQEIDDGTRRRGDNEDVNGNPRE